MGKKKPIIRINISPEKEAAIQTMSYFVGPGNKRYGIKKTSGWDAYMKNKKR